MHMFLRYDMLRDVRGLAYLAEQVETASEGDVVSKE